MSEEAISLNNQLNELRKLEMKINEKLSILYNKKKTVNAYSEEYININEEIRALNDKLYEIYNAIDEINFKLLWCFSPIKSNGIIELRKIPNSNQVDGNELIGYYKICLCGTTEVIGEISYRGYHCDKYMGDIGYSIDSKFQGNNYSYHALCLLSELLKENGIDDFWISVNIHNIPSIKVIEKYGALPGEIVERDVRLYTAQTLSKDQNSNYKR